MGIIKPIMILTAMTAAPRAKKWLHATRTARPLHIFDQVINLVNQDGRVLSVAASAIGNGPFTLLVGEGGFQEKVSIGSAVTISGETLTVGGLEIDCCCFDNWDPSPAWGALTQTDLKTLKQTVHDVFFRDAQELNFPQGDESGNRAAQAGLPFLQTAARAIAQIEAGFRQADPQLIQKGAAALAGLGVGLTPSGDDFLMGMMHGLWARAADQVGELCIAIAQTAIPRTSSLSGAWLEVASQGEASQVWHNLIDAVHNGRDDGVQEALAQILRTGETSGADALSGFYFILNQEQLV